MTYKQKHLALLMTAAATLTLTSGCKKEQPELQKTDKIGLLDDTPLKERDKYDTPVTLYLVDVPVYRANGERIKDTYVLTRALNPSDFAGYSGDDNLSVHKAYFNNSDEAVYVKVNKDNAVLTEKGYVGLFIQNDQAVIVAAENVSEFLSDTRAKSYVAGTPRKTVAEYVSKNDSLKIGEAAPFEQDSIKMHEDTVSWSDSLKMPRVHSVVNDENHQPNDTMQIIKPQRESYE